MVSSRVAFKSMNFSILAGKFYESKELDKKTVNNQKKNKVQKIVQ